MLLRHRISLLFITYVKFVDCYPGEEKHDIGTLAGDVQNWAMLIQNYILQLASDGIKRDLTQSYLDQANYTYEKKNGEEIVQKVKLTLGDYFSKKKRAAERLAEKVREFHDDFLRSNSSINAKVLKDIDERIYRDSDIPSRLPDDIIFNPYFRQGVSLKQSSIKLPDEVPRNDRDVINTVYFTARLEETFLKNAKDDPLLRWQYFGSTTGVMRLYPGREWSTNFAGFYNDYDARIRPWYIAATSGPKDVVVILDCSLSMKGEKFSIGKAVAKTVINTLTKQDYVNVICARASHWDEVGKWHFYNTESLSCVQTDLVPATNSHRKDLIEKIDKLKAGGTSELQKGFEQGLDLLQNPRTGCQSLIVFATDGIDTDGEEVRCGPGYYTRSGYVPGPICKYNYSDVWELVLNRNKHLTPPVRIFSYLIVEDAELFPGNLSCRNNGSMKKLMTGENLISQMSNYFEFLSANAMSSEALWTSPYLDAWGLGLMLTHAIPVLSRITGKYIGVVGIDATLDEIENFLTKHQWGSVDSFLINDQGETIFHPRLKPSKKLLDDPIFTPISLLEQDSNGNPSEFSTILRDMIAGKTGTIRIEKAKGGKPRNYYYAALNNSEYSFAFSLADTDMEFRRSQEPLDRSKYDESYYNLLKEYKGRLLKEKFPGLWKKIDIRENEKKRYPGLRITYKHSTIFLAPKTHCDPTKYMYNDDLAMKTYEAHIWINGNQTDLGCESGKQKFNKGVRADVLITQPIEEIWRTRDFESINQIKWTNVGLRSGVFRTYPGHRSSRGYDPTKRPWYKRTSSAPHKTSISTPYMDAAGVGKINTISQAVFEGMTPKTDQECEVFKGRPLPGGCKCDLDSDCMTKVCYLSKAPGPNADHRRCSTERVEAVTGLDILYDDFQNKTMGSMQASDFRKSCSQVYTCRDGEPGCETRCYLFDSSAKLVMDPDFLLANNLDKSKYTGVTLGRKEGEVMKHLIYEHGFIKRNKDMDFQGSCRISPLAPKVTLEGIPKTPEESDDYYRNRGPIPKFHSEFGCIQDVISFSTVDDKLGSSGMITGNVSGPCMSGFYYVTALPKTNLYLLVIEDWQHYRETLFYNFNCKITRSVVNSGAYRIINGTCAHEDDMTSTLAQRGKCPMLKNITMPCTYTAANQSSVSHFLLVTVILLTSLIKF